MAGHGAQQAANGPTRAQKYGVRYSGTNSMTKPAIVAMIMMMAHKPLAS